MAGWGGRVSLPLIRCCFTLVRCSPLALSLFSQHLNVKNIRIGPKAPAFLTPESLAVIVDKW